MLRLFDYVRPHTRLCFPTGISMSPHPISTNKHCTHWILSDQLMPVEIQAGRAYGFGSVYTSISRLTPMKPVLNILSCPVDYVDGTNDFQPHRSCILSICPKTKTLNKMDSVENERRILREKLIDGDACWIHERNDRSSHMNPIYFTVSQFFSHFSFSTVFI